MPVLRELDPNVSLVEQMDHDPEGPVVLINTFVLGPEDAERFLQAWTADAALMKRQPGFISAQLHQGIGGSAVYVNCALWESVDHFKRAFFNPEFQARLKEYPASVSAAPHLFTRVAVPGLCVGSQDVSRDSMSHETRRQYRVDRFKVSASARAEFLHRVQETHDFLRALPGFIEDTVLEQTDEHGSGEFVTIAVWESEDAVAAARAAVTAWRHEAGFNPQELFSRLGIEADLGNYHELESIS